MLKQLVLAVGVTAVTFGAGVPNIGGEGSVFVNNVEARSFSSSRSFSSRSFSRSTFRSSSSSKKKGMFSGFKSNKSKSIKTGSGSSSIKSAAPKKTSSVIKAKLAASSSKFKTKPKYTGLSTSGKSGEASSVKVRNHYQTKYRDNPVYSRASSYDRSTYWNRRGQYYGDYDPPGYVYNMSPSYGMWDTIFLYYMLSNVSNAGAFAHHHQNDPDYLAWREEADRQARENAELRAQLAAMDAAAAKVNEPVNPEYLPEGVDADITLAEEARAAQRPNLRVCTGSRNGTYFMVTSGVLGRNVNEANIVPVETHGSGQALSYISEGKCDAAFVQGDSYWNYVEDNETTNLPFERVFSPFRESVHLVCHSGGPRSVDELTSKNKVWFPSDSGATETWRNFIGEDEDYADIPTTLTDPSMKVATNEEAILKVRNDTNSCMMYVGAEGASRFMRDIDSGARRGNLVIVEVADGSLDNTTDPAGDDVYDFGTLHEKHYNNLLREGGCYGWCGGDVTTLTMNADFIVSNTWKDKYSKVYPHLANSLIGQQKKIDRAVRQ